MDSNDTSSVTSTDTDRKPKNRFKLIAIVLLIVIVVGALIGFFVKRSMDDQSRKDAQTAVNSYKQSANDQLSELATLLSREDFPVTSKEAASKATQVTTIQNKITKLDVSGEGAELESYKLAKASSDSLNTLFTDARTFYESDLQTYITYMSALNDLNQSRLDGASAVNQAAQSGSKPAGAAAIRDQAIPKIKKALDDYKKVKVPYANDAASKKLDAEVIKTNEDFLGSYAELAKALDSNNNNSISFDYSSQFDAIKADANTLESKVYAQPSSMITRLRVVQDQVTKL